MNRAIAAACWICVIVAGVFLRFDQLSSRPFHADEATGARITASRMESGNYQFDPIHYHGPLLSGLAIPLCEMNHEKRWQDLTKQTLRLVPALAGSLLLLVPLLWRKRFGDAPMLLASALLATSPLLVYYSRMFIHEPLLVLFGMMALFSIIRFPRYGIPGLLIGLMFATKESFAISIVAWGGAAILIAWENRRKIDRAACFTAWKNNRTAILLSLAAAFVSSVWFYTAGFRQPQGAIDAVRTFFVYKTVDGHAKPFTYYLALAAWPVKSGGVWWFGTPVVILALIAFAKSFRPDAAARPVVSFIAYAAAGHFLIYSLIAYKTPWLACLPWAHVCLLAGFAFTRFTNHRHLTKTALILLAVACLVSQFVQTRHATSRLASDERNPFAYVPTRNEIESLTPWLAELRKAAPEISREPAAVVGTDYWPLPWYLRSFEQIGYWPTPPADLAARAIVFAMPDVSESVATRLAKTHIALPRGLRAGVPVTLFIRNDFWKLWMENGK